MQTLFDVCTHFLCACFLKAGRLARLRLDAMQTLANSPTRRPLPSRPKPIVRDEGGQKFGRSGFVFQTARTQRRGGGRNQVIRPSRPVSSKIAKAVAPMMRTAPTDRINSLEEIAKLVGGRPVNWQKPQFGDFEYWLAHNCGWISDSELEQDTENHRARQQRSLEASHRFSAKRFSWTEQPRYAEPVETDEYVPETNMKLINDRNLTDSARRIALFVLRHTYQDNRAGRFIGMTVSFIANGLSVSRRTVQRSLTLLETRGYFRCEVAKGEETRMCIGLIIHLMTPLFPAHRKESWPEKRRNAGASTLSNKQTHFFNTIYKAKVKVSRLTWALRCMNGVARSWSESSQANCEQPSSCGRFQALNLVTLMPALRSQSVFGHQLI